MERDDSNGDAFLTERYEDRVRSLVALVLATGEEIEKDAVIAVMKGDKSTMEFARRRAKEVWENTLAKEREATITALMHELGGAKQTINELTNQLNASHRATVSAEEKTKELTRETESLYEKASASSRNYEELMRKREGDIAKMKGEWDSLATRYKAEIQRKDDELDSLYRDMDESVETVRKLQSDVATLSTKLERAEELEKFHGKLAGEYQENESRLQETMRRVEEESVKANALLRDSQATQLKLEAQLKQQSDLHKKQLESMSRLHSDSRANSEQNYEGELQTLRMKLAASKLQVQDYEMRLEEARRALTASRSEAERERTEWEKRKEAAERISGERETELRTDFQKEIDALHKHYKEIVVEKAKNAEKEFAEEREKWRSAEKVLKERLGTVMEDIHENYVPVREFESSLQERDSQHAQDLHDLTRDLEDSAQKRLKDESDKQRREAQQIIDLLSTKITHLETERQESTLRTKKQEADLQAAAQKIEKLKNALAEANNELSEVQRELSEKMNLLEDMTREAEELTLCLADAKKEGRDWGEEANKLQGDVRSLQDQLQSQELSLKSQLSAQVASEREQNRLLVSECEELKSLSEQLNLELQSYKQLAQELEQQHDAAVSEAKEREAHAKGVIDTVRSEERDRTAAHLRVHAEVREKLASTERELAEAMAEIQQLKTSGTEVKAAKMKCEEQLVRCSTRVSELESMLKQSEKQRREIRSKAEHSRKALKSLMAKYGKLVRSIKQRYRSELTQLQTSLFQELQSCKQSLSSLTSRCVIGVDDRMMSLQRKYQAEIVACQEHAESLQKRLERSRADEQGSLLAAEKNHEMYVRRLVQDHTAAMKQLQTEREAAECHLSQTRTELNRQGALCRETQEQVRRLQGDLSALRDRAKAECEGRIRAMETDARREAAAKDSENQRLNEELTEARSRLQAAEASRSSESAQLVSLFKQKLAEKESALELLRSTSKRQAEEISQLRSDLQQVRKRTEGPLGALQSEVENLEGSLRLEQAKYRHLLLQKDREIEELKTQLRKDTEFTRSLTEAAKNDVERRDSDPRLSGRLSLSQLSPNCK